MHLDPLQYSLIRLEGHAQRNAWDHSVPLRVHARGIAGGWCCSGGQVLAQRHIARSTLETKTLSPSLCLLVSCLPTTDPSELRSSFLDSFYLVRGSKQ